MLYRRLLLSSRIFRKYPNCYESIIATLCENLEDLDEPEAKASMVWIIGEYAERIDNADELLDSFLESFQDETSQVQLQLLTATVKLFLKQPETSQEMVQRVLKMATEESDNPDLRDRGYIYWRLLSSDPEAARQVVLSEKPEITDDTFSLEPSLLEDLMSQIATLSSIYFKPPEAFVIKQINVGVGDEDDEPIDGPDDYPEDDGVTAGSSGGGSSAPRPPQPSGGGDLLDLLDDSPPAPANNTPNLFGSPAPAESAKPKAALLQQDAGRGLFISGVMVRKDGQLALDMDIGFSGPTPVQALAVQFNKNTFGIAPQQPQLSLPSAISNGASVSSVILPLTCTPQMLNIENPKLILQVAVKNMATNDVVYFAVPVDMSLLFKPTEPMDVQALVNAWKSIDDNDGISVVINDIPNVQIEVIKSKLTSKNIAFVAQRDVPGQEGQIVLYFNCQTVTNVAFLVELKFKAGLNMCKLTVKSNNKQLSELCKVAVGQLIVS